MNKVLSCMSHLLLVLMVIKILTAPVIYVDFKMQQDYIAKVLCINKDQPEMHCNGQCILMKKLNKSGADQDQGTEQNPSQKRAFAELLPNTSIFTFAAQVIPADHVSFFEDNLQEVDLDTFVPPPSLG
ncbi:hypothetical protein QWY93_06950 [Echinicola jeungdonensis]|uniref:Uncharacterized protein n=1 Tax=Echinicola jeungdonensis TaxID=709343 RepID=A0ABV5J3M4_9BACT|nr:hypothetical protein [Echinicola jeungdonensis]MDN3669060.1 hypothetical protein [Echinicola jeungdonensis]